MSAVTPKGVAQVAASQDTSLPHLVAALDGAAQDHTRHDAAARLLALAPVDAVKTIGKVFEALERADMLDAFPIYHKRLPEQMQELAQVGMYAGLALYLTGHQDAAYPLIHRAVLSHNGYTISGAALNILKEHADLDEIMDHVLACIIAGQGNRDMTVFAFLAALQEKRRDYSEQLLDIVSTNPVTQHDPHLLFHCARTARSLGTLDHAAELIFTANRIAPQEGMITVNAIEIARLCQSDKWVPQAIILGEAARRKVKNPAIVRQISVTLARLYPRTSDREVALERLADLVDAEDNQPTAVSAVARSQMLLGDTEAAFGTLTDFAQTHDSTDPTVLYDRAGILASQDKGQAAINLINKTLPADKQSVDAQAIIGHIHAWSGNVGQAQVWLKKVLQKSPNHGSAFADMSLCSEFDREYTLALSLADKASSRFVLGGMAPAIGLEFMHQARLRRRMMFLADMAGDTALAHALQREAIFKAPIALPYPIREWSGEALAHTQDMTDQSVVVLAEMGVGDEIRYTSIMHRIAQQAAKITLTCDPRLQSLLERSFPKVNVVPVLRDFPGILKQRVDNRKLAANEAMRKIMSDALIDQSRDADIWMRGRHYFEAQCLDRSRLYQSPDKAVLKPEPALKKKFARDLKARAKGRKVVGLSWRGGRRTYNREPHYFQLTQWLPLLQDPDLCFVNLQYAMRDDELDFLRATLGERFIEFPDLDLFDDMEGIAALCSCLDLVVAICTSVLELTCAVGTHCLYLMRSPQVTHAIRFSGTPDIHGAYQDAVWASCRIIPRFNMKDADVVALGRDYIADYFSS